MNGLAAVAAWVLLAAALGALLLAVRRYQQRRLPDPETARKLYHLGGGLLLLPLPWLFDTAWPVLLLAVLACAAFVALRRHAALHTGLGQVLHAIPRHSYGEFTYAAGVCGAFLLADGDRVRYVAALLVLAVADSAAALAGRARSGARLPLGDGDKTWAGTLAFLGAAWPCLTLPLLAGGGTAWPAALLAGLLVALLLSVAEALGRDGSDNLLLPVLAVLLLGRLQGAGGLALLQQAAVIGLLAALTLALRRPGSPLDPRAAGAALGLYTAWLVGGPDWLAAPAAALLGYALLTGRDRRGGLPPPPGLTQLAVLLGPGLACLAVWQASGGLAALWPAYVTGCAAAFALLGALRARLVDPRRSRLLVTLGYTALGSLPAWPVLRLGGTAAVASWPLSAVATLTAVVLLVTFERTPARYLKRPERWLFPGLLAAGAALVVLLVAGGIGKL